MSREKEICDALGMSDQKAISLIMKDYGPALYGVAFQILKSEESAEDAFQESMIKVWKYAEGFDASKGRLFTWLINITRNTAIDIYRSKSFRNTQKNQDLEFSVDIAGDSYNPDTMDVQTLMRKLEDKYRQVIDLAYFKGYTHAEIVEELQLPLGTIKSRLRIGLRELRKEFEINNSGISGAFLLLALTSGYFLKSNESGH